MQKCCCAQSLYFCTHRIEEEGIRVLEFGEASESKFVFGRQMIISVLRSREVASRRSSIVEEDKRRGGGGGGGEEIVQQAIVIVVVCCLAVPCPWRSGP